MRGSRSGETVALARGALLLVLAAVVLTASALPAGGAGFPRTANVYFPVLLNAAPEELVRLARYDLLVVVASNGEWSPDQLATLRQLNPEIVILPHMCFSYHADWSAPSIYSDLGDALHANDWWLRDTTGEVYRLPNEEGLVNMTTNCPANGQGQRLCDWFGEYLASRLGPGGPWDGIFLDLCMDDISWVVGLTGVEVDSDQDGMPDDAQELNEAWRQGTEIAVARARELVGDDYVFLTNGGNTLWDHVNGSMLEGFPEAPNGWYKNITHPEFGYIANDTHYREPRFNVINPRWSQPAGIDGPAWTGHFIKKFLFTLANTLVFGDAYYAMTSPYYSESWWFFYYDLELGDPLGPAEDAVASPGDVPGVEHGDMIKLRRFSQGIATLNPTNAMQEVTLPGEYYDPEEWTGQFFPLSSTLTSVVMSPGLGRVLVGSGTVRAGTSTITSVEFDGNGIEVTWSGPPWAARHALYRATVRGDGSLGEWELAIATDAMSFRDTRTVPGRRYAYAVSPIGEDKCEGRLSTPLVMSTGPSVDPSVALMVEDPGGMLMLMWTPPNVPGELIFELERRDEGGRREWLGRFCVEGGEAVRHVDDTAEPGRAYRYELYEVRDSERHLVAWVRALAPEGEGGATALFGCSPQPIGRSPATISFRVGDDDNWEDGPPVALTVYDVRGRVVRTLVDRPLPSGDHTIVWDGLDAAGVPVASGCYLYALRVGRAVLRGKAVVIR